MKGNIKKMSFSAMIIALAFALSKIKIIPMPLGGSVTLFSMLAISLPGYFFGLRYGIMSAFIFSLFKLLFGGYVYTPIQVILDYVLSYSIFGITGFFSKNENKWSLIFAYSIAVIFRFIFSTVSGYVFFAEYAPEAWNPLFYTIVYNASYIFAEAIITIALYSIPHISKGLSRLKQNLNR